MLFHFVTVARLIQFGQGVIDLLAGPINTNADNIADLQEAVSHGVGTLSYDGDEEEITFTPPS